MDYREKKNSISRELKRRLKELKEVHVQDGKGTAWGWIDLYRPGCFTPAERDKIQEILGINVGLTNCVSKEIETWEAILGAADARHTSLGPQLEALKARYYAILATQKDMGTCCLGAGTYVLKDGKKVAFWSTTRQAQSNEPAIHTERILEAEARALGLTFQHEAGVID